MIHKKRWLWGSGGSNGSCGDRLEDKKRRTRPRPRQGAISTTWPHHRWVLSQL